ncbi:MAG: pilus assembly protein [Alphaproteobacteria bacterium]|nr:pilus assembly protein [Alphaproteobacteria bacterium]
MRQFPGKLKSFLRSQTGSVTVEFVASVPVLLAGLAVCFEFGRAFLAYEIASTDMEVAARYLSHTSSVTAASILQAENLAQCGTTTTGCTKHWPWNVGGATSPSITETTESCTTTGRCATCSAVGTDCLPFNQDVTDVKLAAQIPMTLSLLGYIGVNELYTMQIVDRVMWIGS